MILRHAASTITLTFEDGEPFAGRTVHFGGKPAGDGFRAWASDMMWCDSPKYVEINTKKQIIEMVEAHNLNIQFVQQDGEILLHSRQKINGEDTEGAGKAKEMFTHYNGRRFHMWQDEVLEEYEQLNVPPEQEEKWRAEMPEEDTMTVKAVKIPKKFGDICVLIRDGKNDGIEKLNAYNGLERQKTAVLAEVAYFDGDFGKALSMDKEICPFWQEWHYGNIRTEHTAAMAFAAKILGREDEITGFFNELIVAVNDDCEMPPHIKNTFKKGYENLIEYMDSGVLSGFSEKETYKPPINPMSFEEIREAVIKENKKLDIDSEKAKMLIFNKICTSGALDDRLDFYERIAENTISTMWHIHALVGYNHTGDAEKAFEVVLRMAKQRLWHVASATQVRPMEFFTHPAVFPFLKDVSYLNKIVSAFQQ